MGAYYGWLRYADIEESNSRGSAKEKSMSEIIIGIDPGKNGGIAVLGDGDPRAVRMPKTEKDVWDLFDSHWIWGGLGDRWEVNVFAYLEKAQAMPGQGVASMFTFGCGYGGLRMALLSLEIPFEIVTASVWQRKMKCLSGGDKNVTKARAQELFPGIKMTHYVADALLIAEYGRRNRMGGFDRKVKKGKVKKNFDDCVDQKADLVQREFLDEENDARRIENPEFPNP